MQYQVVPFRADVMEAEGARKAAEQLATLINQNVAEGWKYHGLETLVTDVTTPATPTIPGKSGCLGFGATEPILGRPETTRTVQVYVAVFYRET
ncbi:hypothetical protein HUU39_13570 [candidate division KSB1 bacterium]|nr:hypothetical protein [bacterium]NUM66293.1 hypothetical protein [candidate division KSB1 bacterium]